MMSKPTLRALAGLVLGLLVGLAASGCGNPSENDSGKTGTVNVSVDEKLHKQLPSDIARKGTIVMATDAGIGTPFATREPGSNEISGFDVDLGQALAQRLGVKLEVKQASFGSLIPGLQAGRYDFAASVMYDTKERQKVVDFVDYAKDGTGILSKAGRDLEHLKIADFCGLKVGTVPGSTAVPKLKAQSKKCTAADKKPVTVKVLDSNASTLLAVTSGRIDLTTGDALQYAYLAKKQPDKFQLAGEPLNTGIDAMAFPKHSKLVPVMQKALQKMMDDGSYKDLMEKYGFTGGMLSKATINKGTS